MTHICRDIRAFCRAQSGTKGQEGPPLDSSGPSFLPHQPNEGPGGTVARRTVKSGRTVSPERQLMAIVAFDDTWVVANFKEDQLRAMRAGRRPRSRLIPSAAAPRPATSRALRRDGLHVRRVPVLVRLDASSGVVLPPGMSAFVKVAVGN